MNGNHAPLLVLEPEKRPAQQPTPDKSGIETELGSAVADAAIALCQAGQELQNGGLTAATRRAGAERIYRLHELRRGMKGADFIAAARAGKQILRRHLAADPDFHRLHGPSAGEATMDNIICEILATLERVAEFERGMAN